MKNNEKPPRMTPARALQIALYCAEVHTPRNAKTQEFKQAIRRCRELQRILKPQYE